MDIEHNLSSDVGEVNMEVGVEISRLPHSGEVHLHVGPVYSLAPVQLVLVSSDDRESP